MLVEYIELNFILFFFIVLLNLYRCQVIYMILFIYFKVRNILCYFENKIKLKNMKFQELKKNQLVCGIYIVNI
jgi:hypothetical protein